MANERYEELHWTDWLSEEVLVGFRREKGVY